MPEATKKGVISPWLLRTWSHFYFRAYVPILSRFIVNLLTDRVVASLEIKVFRAYLHYDERESTTDRKYIIICSRVASLTHHLARNTRVAVAHFNNMYRFIFFTLARYVH